MAGVFLRCSRNRNFSARKQFFGFHKFSCFLEPVPIINIFWRYPRCLRTRGIDKLLCILPSYPRKSGTAFLLSLFFYPCLYSLKQFFGGNMPFNCDIFWSCHIELYEIYCEPIFDKRAGISHEAPFYSSDIDMVNKIKVVEQLFSSKEYQTFIQLTRPEDISKRKFQPIPHKKLRGNKFGDLNLERND